MRKGLPRQKKAFSSDKKVEFGAKYGNSPLFEHHTTSLVFNDPPLHTRVGKMIMGALLPRALVAMESGLVSLVDRLLTQMEAKQSVGGEVDLIEDFAEAIPVEIIGNLLDAPADERGPPRGWSLAILGALEPNLSEAQMTAGNRAVTEFLAYLEGLVAARRLNPGNLVTDVLTRLIQGKVGGKKLTRTELLQNCIFLLNAGHKTTTNLIGNALALLAEWPQARADLADAPESIDTAIEDFLRFESPNQLGNRITTEPVEIGGVEFPDGTQIATCIGAANRDPEVLDEPNRLDIRRRPNQHLAFASGHHQCAGVNVARMEARVALAKLLGGFPTTAFQAGPRGAGGQGFAALQRFRLN